MFKFQNNNATSESQGLMCNRKIIVGAPKSHLTEFRKLFFFPVVFSMLN